MPDERFWDQILPLLEEGRVVPIVGRDLLAIDADGQHANLYEHLARRLGKRLGIEGAAPASLEEVARRYMAECRQPLEDIYPALKKELTALESSEPSGALRRLAEIEWFRLYVSTTFDDLLCRAVDAARYDGAGLTTSLAFGLMNNFKDLPDELENLQRAVVYQLFGRASAVQDTYAVTEEDLLEFVHTLQIETQRPRRLFDALESNHLLLLGGGFSPWMVRFFLRAVKHRDRLWQVRGRAGFVVDRAASEDRPLIEFLRAYSDRTLIYHAGTPEQFVDELWTHWSGRRPASARADASAPRADGMPRHAVFLSYASEDRSIVESIRTQLDEAGLDAWFDRLELQPGQSWAREIAANIDAAAVFVPVISSSVLQRTGREFRVDLGRHRRARGRLGDHGVRDLAARRARVRPARRRRRRRHGLLPPTCPAGRRSTAGCRRPASRCRRSPAER